MEDLKIDKKLSPQEYWDKVLAKAQLPRINNRRSYHYRVTMDFIDRHIRGTGYSTFFEVGCGSSGWLPYFAKEYGLKVSGIDYSEIGCRLAEENLKMLNISYGEIICKDLFEPNCNNGQKYDIVFSYGVIEHFDNPGEVMAIFSDFLNPGGIIITLVPNLNGLMGRMQKYFVPDIIKMHKVITRSQLQKYHENSGLENITTSYVGTFTIAVIPLVSSNRWVFTENSIQKKIGSFLFNAFDKTITRLFSLLRINIPSRNLSPYVLSIARRDS
jgi:2-polyprenyl-3-methyl-5-hydroxy-6-metoxy-1,4-benzoquinol methylase